jgi:hypothetical protein
MMKILRNVEEHGTTVVLDDCSFVDCKFTHCTVLYHGGDVGLFNTNFSDCRLILNGAAGKTAVILGCFGWKPAPEWNTQPALPATGVN